MRDENHVWLPRQIADGQKIDVHELKYSQNGRLVLAEQSQERIGSIGSGRLLPDRLTSLLTAYHSKISGGGDLE